MYWAPLVAKQWSICGYIPYFILYSNKTSWLKNNHSRNVLEGLQAIPSKIHFFDYNLTEALNIF